ncbi:MAG: glycosyltransferase family 2 protein [Gammaproteobacteria bacterium]|nr:glycosyltransferase family 2 protein [Gammaproteobacteria bacterium]
MVRQSFSAAAVPTVSVVVPTFNCLDYLPHALASVLGQGLEAIEVVVIDDGSTDGSWPWLQQAAETEPRLRVLRTSHLGPAGARNLGIDRARGQLVAFIDADDVWMPGKLERQLRFHRQYPTMTLSFGNYRQVDESSNELGAGFDAWQHFRRIAYSESGYRLLPRAAAVLFAENPVGTSTAMVRRDVLQRIGGFDESLPSAEDWDLWLRLAAQGSVGFTDAPSATYRVRVGSETSKSDARFAALDIIYDRYAAMAAADPVAPRIARARFAAARAQHHREHGQYARSLVEHLRAFTIHPSRRALHAASVDARHLLFGRRFRLHPPRTPSI